MTNLFSFLLSFEKVVMIIYLEWILSWLRIHIIIKALLTKTAMHQYHSLARFSDIRRLVDKPSYHVLNRAPGSVEWQSNSSMPSREYPKFGLGRVIVSIVFLNTLRPRQNGRHFRDDSFKWIILDENVWISIEVSLKFVPKGLINNIPALVQIMAGRRPGDKPLSEPMMVSLLTHICVTQPQWVKYVTAPPCFTSRGIS